MHSRRSLFLGHGELLHLSRESDFSSHVTEEVDLGAADVEPVAVISDGANVSFVAGRQAVYKRSADNKV